jgi:hypothetical protein
MHQLLHAAERQIHGHYTAVKGKGHPITGHEGPTGGVEI